MLRVLGLDLSTTMCGWAMTDLEGNLITFGHQALSGTVIDRCKQVDELMRDLIYGPLSDRFIIAIEIPRGWSADVLFKLGRIHGAVYLAVSSFTKVIDIAEYGPEQGKIALSGKGNAKKEEQIEAFLRLYPNWQFLQKGQPHMVPVIPRSRDKMPVVLDDEADAYGLALCMTKGKIARSIISTGLKGVYNLKQFEGGEAVD